MTPQHHLPADIERTSFSIITEELAQRGVTLSPETEAVVKRVIHTTADFDYAQICALPMAQLPQVWRLSVPEPASLPIQIWHWPVSPSPA